MQRIQTRRTMIRLVRGDHSKLVYVQSMERLFQENGKFNFVELKKVPLSFKTALAVALVGFLAGETL